jgi:catechol-2,3-dioxygenase
MTTPKKLSHLVLQTNRRQEMIDWYCTVLGAELMFAAERISFISYDKEHHRLAFVDPGPLAPHDAKAAGLNHIAFGYADLDEWIDNYLRLRELGIRPERCTNHGITTSMYYSDPDGNGVELFVDNFATAEAGHAYMKGRSTADKHPTGIAFDPEEMVEQVRKGLRIEELASINA